MMDARIKALWLDALRSDEFEQGTGALCRPAVTEDGKKSACCLGVLNELAAREGVIGVRLGDDSDPDGALFRYGKLGDRYFLPVEVQKWAHLGSQNPLIGGLSLATRNDGDPDRCVPAHSFREIADLIEEHL